MEEIKVAFNESQIKEHDMVNTETVDLMRQKRHSDWESEAMSEVRSSIYSTSRANPILKTSMETPGGSLQTELINWGELDARERQKLEMRENRRNATAAIKMVGASRQETHQAWEDNLDLEAKTLQEYYSANGIDLDIT
jgi:hypothetical protein